MEINVFCAGAAKEAITRLAPGFQAQTGYGIIFTFGTVGMLKDKLDAGDTADVAILTAEALQQLSSIVPTTIVELGKVGVGVAVRCGAELPDITTVAAFRQTLLTTQSIAYADPSKGATSGIHFANVAAQLGIADAIKQKSMLLPGNSVVEAVVTGKAELAIQQITEIVPIKGVMLAGPLPPELQKITTYAVGITKSAASSTAAADFVCFLKSDQARPFLHASGFGQF